MKRYSHTSAVTLVELMVTLAISSGILGVLAFASLGIGRQLNGASMYITGINDTNRIVDAVSSDLRRATRVSIVSGGATTVLKKHRSDKLHDKRKQRLGDRRAGRFRLECAQLQPDVHLPPSPVFSRTVEYLIHLQRQRHRLAVERVRDMGRGTNERKRKSRHTICTDHGGDRGNSNPLLHRPSLCYGCNGLFHEE